jgi:putative transposase
MRRAQSKLPTQQLQAEVQRDLAAVLAWKDYGRRVTAELLLRLLSLAAALRTSLSAAVRRGAGGISWETVRRAVHTQLPKADDLIDPLRAALQRRLPRPLRRRRCTVAIDVHERCYYGKARQTVGIRGGKPKAGTKWFWAYATAVLVDAGQRWTVGLVPVRKGEAMDVIVGRLLGQIDQAGLRLRRVLLDRGFYSARVVAVLQQRRAPFVMPVVRCGKGAGGTQRFFGRRVRGRFRHTWESRDRKNGKPAGPTVTVSLACVPPPRGRKRPLVYAYAGKLGAPAELPRLYRWLRQTYRRRFGIESSYRQLGQGLALTTSRSRAYRLLLVGVALLLRNAWVWWASQVDVAWTLNRLLDELRLLLAECLPRSEARPQQEATSAYAATTPN